MQPGNMEFVCGVKAVLGVLTIAGIFNTDQEQTFFHILQEIETEFSVKILSNFKVKESHSSKF